VKKLIIVALLLTCLLATFACGAPPPTPTPSPIPTPIPSPIAPPSPPVTPTRIPITEEGAVELMPELGLPWATRMIVRTAAISLVVNDVTAALDQVAELAENLGGYVVSSKRWKEEERLIGIITIRVPAEDFREAMAALRGMAVDITHEDTSAQDVTEEYVDLSAKLKNLEATEGQLLQLMEKAEKVEDILLVQKELSRTRGEIEQTKGRMQYLERTSATSLIQVQLDQAELWAHFSASKKTVKEGEKVHFEAQIIGGFPPYSYEWSFGDGETSTILSFKVILHVGA